MSVLEPIAPDLWVADYPMRVGGMPFGTRMTVIRLGGGELFLHSPIALDDELAAAVDELGRVAHVIAPNCFHHLFAPPWKERYPDARLYGAPGLAQKKRQLPIDVELGEVAEPAWSEPMGQHVFRGAPRLGEVLFVHRPSRTLLVTDLAFNFGRGGNWLHRLYLRLSKAHDCFGQSLLIKWLVKDEAAARSSVEQVMRWRFDRIIPTHGRILETGGREAFEGIFDWLPRAEPVAASTGVGL